MEISFDLFLEELSFKELLTQKNVSDIRQYVSKKYPDYSQQHKAIIFADAVNRIVSDKLSVINNAYRNEIVQSLLKEGIKKSAFVINAADVFHACINTKVSHANFLDEVSQWCASILEKPHYKDSIKNFTLQFLEERSPLENTYDFTEASVQSCLDPEELLTEELPTQKIRAHIENNISCYHDMSSPKQFRDISSIISDKFITTLNLALTKCWEHKKILTSITAGVILLSISYAVISRLTSTSSPVNSSLEVSNEKSYSSTSAKFLASSSNSRLFHMDKNIISRSGNSDKLPQNIVKYKNKLNMRATAYDLSYESCGKTREHPEYGITYTGTRAKLGRTIAVDPDIIPLGSKMYILFPKEYDSLNGIYYAEDTGSLVKGNTIDVFWGEDRPGETKINTSAMKFGIREVIVYILE